EKAQVVICGRDLGRLDEAVEHVRSITGVTIEAVQADVTNTADIAHLVDCLDRKYGKLDVLVNNAGTGIYKPFADVTDEDLQAGMSVNFFAQFRLTQRALPLLKKAGTSVVINVSG